MEKNKAALFNEKLKHTWKYWRLHSNQGRQVWELNTDYKQMYTPEEWLDLLRKEYYFDKSKNPNSADLIYRTSRLQEFVPYPAKEILSPEEIALYKGFHFYQYLQTEEGNFPGDYGGPHFLLPGLIFAS